MTSISPTTRLAATALNTLTNNIGKQQFSLPSVFNIRCMLAPQQGASMLAGLLGVGQGCHNHHSGQIPSDPDTPAEPISPQNHRGKHHHHRGEHHHHRGEHHHHRGGCILDPNAPRIKPYCPPEPDCIVVKQEWTVSQQENGRATIDLGDTYELELNENNSQIIVRNKETGEETNIWGDPHVDWNNDGKTDANFWEKTTFQLEDGTKITIDTEKFKNNDMYVANDITITKGDQVIQVTGLSQNEKGDMQINQSNRGGYLMDMLVTDGFVVQENAYGEGWINPETGKMATQEDFNITKPGTEKPYEFCQEFGRSLGIFLMTGMMNWNWDS